MDGFEPFSEDHGAFRRTVREYVERELVPHALEWDERGEFPLGLFQEFGKLGFFGIRHDPEYGGSGLDYWYVVAYAEELARSGNAGLVTSMLVHGEMATPVIADIGTEEQKREFLAPAIRGERVAALAISEPDAGSDVASIRTTARKSGDEFVVNGSKMWITNGARADFLTMAVRTGGEGHGGISLLLFPTDVAGFTVSKKLIKVGLKSSDTAVLFFDGCRVPARYLLGEMDRGFSHIMTNFQGERLIAAVHAIAAMTQMLEETLEYGEGRKAFGRPVKSFQAWRHRLADHFASLEAARWLTYRACDLYNRGQLAVREISMAKLFACELAQKVAYDCMQLHGGMGYVFESPIARAWCDVRALTIAGGTSEIMRELVARSEGL